MKFKVNQYDVGETEVTADSFEIEEGRLVFYTSAPNTPVGFRKSAAFNTWLSVRKTAS